MALPSQETLDDEAMQWFLRLRDPSASEADRRAFEAWLAQSERHADAYAEAEQLWQAVEAPAKLLAKREASARPSSSTQSWPWAAAACLLLTLLLGFGAWRDPGLFDRWMADLATAPGHSQQVTLEDGTRLFIDADSAVDIEMTDGGRQLTLRRGRLWVDVVSEPLREFSVLAGEVRTQVVGTRFAVERRADDVRVTVEEGRVVVSHGQGAASNERVVLGANQEVELHYASALGMPSEVDARSRLAWARGQLLFDQTALDEVAVQLERMLPGRVVVSGDEAGAYRLSGSFPANDPDAILDALETSLGITVRRLPGATWLASPAYSSHQDLPSL
ncbi:FecR domain-containing protein [Halomonas sp. ML-15]|uniref:FecR family protein n=1 Tax=Halomonas sp. ML-15 TaxID=2773305 RepID=UPI0017466D28|nr:FecR domain-containing protein [Halomonas sp. ML-15]MBD3896442.1 FecR domain-containing protein [Halomonas sp. ML-15]